MNTQSQKTRNEHELTPLDREPIRKALESARVAGKSDYDIDTISLAVPEEKQLGAGDKLQPFSLRSPI